MFQGETAITIDDKGRLAIPTAYRELVARGCGNRLVLVYNVYDAGCLWLLQHAQWEVLRDQLNARGMKSAQVRTLRRKLVASAVVVEPDGNGRISLPASMRANAGIDRKAVLLGIGDRFELWGEQEYQMHMRQTLGDAELDDELQDLSL
jgi:MraZ protein